METSDELSSAWAAIAAEQKGAPGWYERRISTGSGVNLFAALSYPDGLQRLTLKVAKNVSVEGLHRETRGYLVHHQYLQAERKVAVHLDLLSGTFRELFQVVAFDVVESIALVGSDGAAVAALGSRLDHWQKFMQASGERGLSREVQIGLIGELRFLELVLDAGCAAHDAVAAWQGPLGANHDFRTGAHSVEVKATSGNSPTRVRIANELQLDDCSLESLHLLHLWFEQSAGSGVSLPGLIDRLYQRLPEAVAEQLRDRLLQVGYHQVHRDMYEETKYAERARNYYRVDDAFPRVRPAILMMGVSEVEYTVDLAAASACQLPEDDVLEVFGGAPSDCRA